MFDSLRLCARPRPWRVRLTPPHVPPQGWLLVLLAVARQDLGGYGLFSLIGVQRLRFSNLVQKVYGASLGSLGSFWIMGMPRRRGVGFRVHGGLFGVSWGRKGKK